MNELRAFHNKQEIKDKYISRIKEHMRLEHITKGVGYENNKGKIKGCAVGCTLEGYNHSQYEVELGIPEWLAHIEDKLFEEMSLKKSKIFPLLFLEAINVGADLDKVKAPFMIYILEQCLTYFDNLKYPDVTICINQVIDLYKTNETNIDKWQKAYIASKTTAKAAEDVYAAAYAAYASSRAVDASSRADVDATYAAAYAARAAYASACAAYDAAEDVCAAAYAAYASSRADVDATEDVYNKYADKLLELLKECN